MKSRRKWGKIKSIDGVEWEKQRENRVKKIKIKRTPIEKIGKRFANKLARKATPAERAFRNKLLEIAIGFSFQRPFSNKGTLYIADFYIPNFALIIELDGGYHNTEQQKIHDMLRDSWFKKLGYNIWRMTNEDAFAITTEEILHKFGSYKRIILPWPNK
jgi:ATP-dependent DNA helicase RecG